MAERLTKKISKPIQDKYSLGNYLYYDFAVIDDTNKLLNKLGELEDIMEKYDIPQDKLEDYIITEDKVKQIHKEVLSSQIKEIVNNALLKIKKDRDTWQRACELACAFLAGITQDNVCDYEDYFYQPAKTEGNDE